jgi:hypothetical protein
MKMIFEDKSSGLPRLPKRTDMLTDADRDVAFLQADADKCLSSNFKIANGDPEAIKFLKENEILWRQFV